MSEINKEIIENKKEPWKLVEYIKWLKTEEVQQLIASIESDSEKKAWDRITNIIFYLIQEEVWKIDSYEKLSEKEEDLYSIFNALQSESLELHLWKEKKENFVEIAKKTRQEEFKDLISLNVWTEDLKSYDNIDDYFENASPENISDMLEFISDYPNNREDFINKGALEEYLEYLYKDWDWKILVGFEEWKENAIFTITEDLTPGEKRAIATYWILFWDQIKKQEWLLEWGSFDSALTLWNTNEWKEKFSDLELKLLRSLFVVKWIRDNIIERKQIVDNYRRKIKSEEKILVDKWEDIDKNIDLEARIENIQDSKKDILEKIYERAWVEESENLFTLLEDKIDLKTERINLKLLSPGDLWILKEEWFFLWSLFLIWEDWEMAKKETVSEVWNKFVVNFWWNSSLEKTVWAGDLLIPYSIESGKDYPEEIRINDKQTWKVNSDPRVWFYNWEKYRAIYSDYIVEITKVWNISNPTNYKESFDKRNIVFRREQVREYIKNSIYAKSEILKPLTNSKIDKKAFALEVKSINPDYINFNEENNTVEITDLEKLEKEYLQLYPVWVWKWDGWFKSMSDEVADEVFWDDSFWCSWISRLNAENQFWIKIPKWHANVAQKMYTVWVKSKKWVLEVKDFSSWEFNEIDVKNSDFVDIFMNSPTKMGKEYWHRAVWYKWWGKWYVLDAYCRINNRTDLTKPIKMSDYISYMRGKKYWFERVAYYDSPNISENEVLNWNNESTQSYWNIENLEQNEKKIYNSLYKWLWHISKKMQTRLSKNPEIVKIVLDNSKKYGVDYRLIFAIISQESAFKATAGSSAWARGYMQLMPGTARWLWVDINSVEWNIKGGIKYFSQQMKSHNNNIVLALASYNAWPWNVRKYWGVPPFNETRHYTKIIPQRYNILKRYM